MPSSLDDVLLCGCGWLGQQLLPCLIERNHKVIATTRSKEKASRFDDLDKVVGLVYDLAEPFPAIELLKPEKTTAVIMLPPGRKHTDLSIFQTRIFELISHLSKSSLSHCIYISTTSVYGERTREGLTETSQVEPNTDSAKLHVMVEKRIRTCIPNTHTIVRLAGLVGPNRHPAYSLSGRTLTQPDKRVNLVHSEDVVRAINTLIQRGPSTKTLHLCSTKFPSREEYYHWSAEQLGIEPPKFTTSDDNSELGKTINAVDSWTHLNLTPTYPSPYDMVASGKIALNTP